MKEKTNPVNSNINTNNNTNNVNIKVHVEQPKKRTAVKKKADPNWYTRTIVGGIIALILSVSGYYIKKNMDNKSKTNSTIIVPDGHAIEGKQQN